MDERQDGPNWHNQPIASSVAKRLPGIVALRERYLRQDVELPPTERGAIPALLGSAERAFALIERTDGQPHRHVEFEVGDDLTTVCPVFSRLPKGLT